MFLRQFILGFVFLVSSSFASSNTEFTYNVIDGDIEVTGCVDECPGDLNIPSVIDGYVVKKIGDYAFYNDGLNSATFPDTLEVIGYRAFEQNFLKSIFIPDSVISIGHSSFASNQLENLVIPNTLRFIPFHAFIYNNLNSVTLPEGLIRVGISAFSNNNLTSISLPESLEMIGSRAFAHNNLTQITLPESLKYIGNQAFQFNDIFEITIPKSVIFIDDEAFWYNELNIIHFNGDMPTIAFTAFDKNSITSVTYCQNTENLFWATNLIAGVLPQPHNDCGTQYSGLFNFAMFDIDQSGSVDALSDGLILLRYFFGLRGDSLISGVISPDANRTSAADIEAYIESHMP
jgi:hypothetical protein